MAEVPPVTCSTLRILWKNRYTPLPAVDAPPDEWSLPDTGDVDCAESHDRARDQSGVVCGVVCGVEGGTRRPDDVSVTANHKPSETATVQYQQPGDEPLQRQTQSGSSAISDAETVKQQVKQTAKSHRCSDGELARKVVHRNGMCIIHDGAIVPVRRAKTPNSAGSAAPAAS
jgi:hypothetical protein